MSRSISSKNVGQTWSSPDQVRLLLSLMTTVQVNDPFIVESNLQTEMIFGENTRFSCSLFFSLFILNQIRNFSLSATFVIA